MIDTRKFLQSISKLIGKEKTKIKVAGGLKSSKLRVEQNHILKREICVLPGIKRIINIGAIQEDGDKEGNLYRDYFPNSEYYTLDKNRGAGNGYHFNIDVEELGKPNRKFDLVLLMNVLEHIRDPFKAAIEVSEVMNPDGYLFVSVPFFYPIHVDKENRYGDHWRFTESGLKILFKDLSIVWIKRIDSVILKVRDRKKHWNNENTASGFCALFRKR